MKPAETEQARTGRKRQKIGARYFAIAAITCLLLAIGSLALGIAIGKAQHAADAGMVIILPFLVLLFMSIGFAIIGSIRAGATPLGKHLNGKPSAVRKLCWAIVIAILFGVVLVLRLLLNSKRI